VSLRLRLALVAALAAAVVGTGAGTARACSNLAFSITTLSVGPGGSVRFTISGTTAGAAWTVSISGYGAVKSGTATHDSVVDSFTMPSLGSTTHAVSVSATVAHADIEDSPAFVPNHMTFTYQAPAPPQPQQQQPQQPQQQPAAQQQTTKQVETPTTSSSSAVAPQPASAGSTGSRPAPSSGHSRPSQASSTRAATSSRSSRAGRQTAAPVVRVHTHAGRLHAFARAVAVGAPSLLAHAGHAPKVQRPASSPAAPLVVGGRRATGRQPVVGPEFKAAGAYVGGTEPKRASLVRWLSIGSALLFLALASAAGGLLVRRRRRDRGGSPNVSAPEVEAELQEIIAEERAKHGGPIARP
jgi:hypothetical protein